MLRVALRSRRAAGFAVWQLAALLVGEAAGRETELHGSAFHELAGPPRRQRLEQQAGRRDLADRECTCQGGTPPHPERVVPRSAAVALAGQLSPPTNAGAVTAGVGRARMGGSGQRSMKQAQVPDAGGGFGSVKTCP